ncbi:MAG: integrase core domain-containing protein, partial [Patescibacteria group bacterium]
KFNQRMTKWLIHYNFERPHQSLGYLPPLEWVVKYYPKVLPMYPVHTQAFSKNPIRLNFSRFNQF